jgi:prepilin-type N-terminal cleavage/methylation domain-containing protein
MMNQKGFSLAELLIAAAMTSLLMAGVFVILQQGENAYLYGAGRAEVQQTARGALDRLARELRTGSTVTAVTANVAAGSISFQYIDDTETTVTVAYSLAGTNLQRNQTVPFVAGQPETVIGGVTQFQLTCYDANNVATTTAANVRTVNVRLGTQVQDAATTNVSPKNQRAVVEDRVRMRNLL